MIKMWHPDTKIDFGSSGAQHPLPITDRFDADGDERSLDRCDTRVEPHLNPVRIVGHHHWPGEPNEIGSDPARVSYPIRDDPKRCSHGERSVSDDTGQPNPPCEVLRVVDRVEVGRSTRITN